MIPISLNFSTSVTYDSTHHDHHLFAGVAHLFWALRASREPIEHTLRNFSDRCFCLTGKSTHPQELNFILFWVCKPPKKSICFQEWYSKRWFNSKKHGLCYFGWMEILSPIVTRPLIQCTAWHGVIDSDSRLLLNYQDGMRAQMKRSLLLSEHSWRESRNILNKKNTGCSEHKKSDEYRVRSWLVGLSSLWKNELLMPILMYSLYDPEWVPLPAPRAFPCAWSWLLATGTCTVHRSEGRALRARATVVPTRLQRDNRTECLCSTLQRRHNKQNSTKFGTETASFLEHQWSWRELGFSPACYPVFPIDWSASGRFQRVHWGDRLLKNPFFSLFFVVFFRTTEQIRSIYVPIDSLLSTSRSNIAFLVIIGAFPRSRLEYFHVGYCDIPVRRSQSPS